MLAGAAAPLTRTFKGRQRASYWLERRALNHRPGLGSWAAFLLRHQLLQRNGHPRRAEGCL
jgi:hypothetical protein